LARFGGKKEFRSGTCQRDTGLGSRIGRERISLTQRELSPGEKNGSRVVVTEKLGKQREKRGYHACYPGRKVPLHDCGGMERGRSPRVKKKSSLGGGRHSIKGDYCGKKKMEKGGRIAIKGKENPVKITYDGKASQPRNR